MIRGGLIATAWAAGCWTGPTPTAPSAPPVRARASANTRFPGARISAVRECVPTGRTLLVVTLSTQAETLELDLAYAPGSVLPQTFVEGQSAEISVCAVHGCTGSSLTLEALELGVGARGRYHVEANAGPSYDDTFEATWAGTPWEVRACDYEMNPP